MKTANIGDYFLWKGQLVQCQWMGFGEKTIGFIVKTKVTCPHCKGEHEITEGYDIVESSPLFQEGAAPIKSITEN